MEQIGLFGGAAVSAEGDAPAAAVEKWCAPDVMSIAARECARLPNTMRWVQAEVIDRKDPKSAFLLHMAEPIGTYKSGPRKGESKFPAMKDCRRVVIGRADIDRAEAEWEATHGVCLTCGGSGNDPLSSYARTCHRCKGSGKPKVGS